MPWGEVKRGLIFIFGWTNPLTSDQRIQTHTHTLWLSALGAAEGSPALPAQESTENVPKGVAPHLGALFHPHFPFGLARAGLADLGAFCSRVGVAAASEGTGEPLLGRHHLKPVPYRRGTRKTEEEGKRRRKKKGSDEKGETGNGMETNSVFFFLNQNNLNSIQFHTEPLWFKRQEVTRVTVGNRWKKETSSMSEYAYSSSRRKKYEMSSMSTIGKKYPTSGEILKCA